MPSIKSVNSSYGKIFPSPLLHTQRHADKYGFFLTGRHTGKFVEAAQLLVWTQKALNFKVMTSTLGEAACITYTKQANDLKE